MRRLLAVIVCAAALTACRIDAKVTVTVLADGSGTITLLAVADADVVANAPGLADDLRFEDAIARGWTVTGPEPTPTGGLQVQLAHSFATVEEATALLGSLNGTSGPLHDVALVRAVTDDSITTSLSGRLRVDGGLDAFADPDVLAAIGGTPFAEHVAAANLRPADAVAFTFAVELPGDVATTASSTEPVLEWSVPLDATPIDLAVQSVLPQGTPSSGWGTVATIALVVLVGWCVLAAGFISFVVVARRNRARRHHPA